MVNLDRSAIGRSPMSTTAPTRSPIRLGLRENLAQFSLLVGVNALVGGMIGQERTVLPLLAEDEFGLTKFTATLTFIAAFGIVKAATEQNFPGFESARASLQNSCAACHNKYKDTGS